MTVAAPPADTAGAPRGTALLAIDGLAKTYRGRGTPTEALGGLTLEVEAGEFLCVVGPSGCGKTTLLKLLSGLLPATSGRVVFDGAEVTEPPEGLAVVFQEYTRSLLPWFTVQRNVTLPLEARGMSRRERLELAGEALRAVRLSDFASKYPWELSGGMQQRVAIARALASQPRLLLMDEPFASVDAQTRADLEDLVARVHREFEVTTLFVTHDIDEAVYLGDRVSVLSARPAVQKALVRIGLERPRDQIKTRAEREFVELRSEIGRLVLAERDRPESEDGTHP
jgi:NitT/TauT family transport system ATP-binding protein